MAHKDWHVENGENGGANGDTPPPSPPTEEEMAEKARYLTTQAKDDPVRYIHNEIGYNFRLTNIQAALGVAQLEQLTGFLKPGRRIPLPYEIKDDLLLALYRLGPEGGFGHQLIQITPLSPAALDGGLRRSRRTNHVVRSLQREQLPVRGTAHRHKLSWRGLAYLWERFGLQFET